VLDDEQGHAVGGEGPQHAGQRGHFARVEPGSGLVEEQDTRAARQGPGEFHTPQGAGRQPRRGQGPYRPVEPQQPRHAFHGARIHDAPLLGPDPHVLGHRQRRENGKLLKCPRHTESRAGVRRQPGHIPLPEHDPPRVRPHSPGETVKQGALPGPVRADDGGDRARAELEIDPVEGGEAAVGDAQAAGAEQTTDRLAPRFGGRRGAVGRWGAWTAWPGGPACLRRAWRPRLSGSARRRAATTGGLPARFGCLARAVVCVWAG
jgi:hypothetical protein